MKRYALLFLCIFTVGTVSVQAQLHLPQIFSDHMVIQQEKPILVWGAEAGESVTIQHFSQTITDSTGAWRSELPAMKAGGPFNLTNFMSKGSVTFIDMLIGGMWVASGQSNMAWLLNQSNTVSFRLTMNELDQRA
ncbi:hypothetical protein [Fodinibius salsisoli]|uniref:Sialate O-acetylesterase n=1 Tax=Fodinibius salsisoli TaxID=2820877 RepID=A0ABT3PSH5_9BACT|nr:hypothetical protein [Fodinibius salsisoli]MCW9708822.1 hypothetical protein [Fodinibius salsisoli]